MTASLRRASTAHDVARLAGVSQSAVSRAFTDGASISADMRAKVLAAAKSLDYRPNLIARSLITRRSNIIGVAMGYLENQFYPTVLEALSKRLSQMGLRLLLFTTDPAKEVDPQLQEILHYKIDGLILASASLSSVLAEECRQAGVPVVLFNRTTAAASVSSVTGDNERGARVIADFLVRGGHQRLAYIAGLEHSSTSRQREQGFMAAVGEAGLAAPRREAGHYDFQQAMGATRRLLSQGERPDALFCANDHMALAAIEVARSEFGLTIGQDLSVVGFDDVPMAAWPGYGLTTFSQPVEAMVERTVALIQAQRHHSAAPAQVVVPGALIVRSSARRPQA